jgi:hypothetical protein
MQTDNLVPKDKEEAIKQSIAETQASVDSIVIEDDGSLQVAAEILGRVKVNTKRLNELEDQLTKPFSDAVKGAKSWFKAQLSPFLEMESSLKRKMGAYMEAVQKKADEEAKALEIEAAKAAAQAEKKGEPAPVTAPVPVARPASSVQTTTGKASAKKPWKYEIVDESKLPRVYLEPNLGAIQRSVREGVREIEGVRIFEHTDVSFRS